MSRHDDDGRAGILAPPQGLKVHYARDGIRVASLADVALVYWGSRAVRESVRAVSETSALLIKKHGRISVVQIIPDNVGLPDDETREKLRKLVEVGAASLACLAYVLAGDGFWASAVRALITNTAWVGQRPFTARTFPTLEEVAEWLPAQHAERTRTTLDPIRLLDAMRHVSSSELTPAAARSRPEG